MQVVNAIEEAPPLTHVGVFSGTCVPFLFGGFPPKDAHPPSLLLPGSLNNWDHVRTSSAKRDYFWLGPQ